MPVVNFEIGLTDGQSLRFQVKLVWEALKSTKINQVSPCVYLCSWYYNRLGYAR